MSITPAAGYQVDPNNANGVIPFGSSTAPQTTLAQDQATAANQGKAGYDTWGNPTATAATTINSNSLSPSPLMSYQQPQQVPVFDTSGLAATAAGMQSPYSSLTQPQQKEQDVNQSIQDLNSFLSGEGQFKTDQYKAQGFGTTTDANGNISAIDPQMADLNAQLTTLTNNAKAIPLQDQQNATGRGITAGGLAPIDSANLRNNAIQALQVSSTISARNGALAHATDLVNIATQQKFGAAESQLKAQTANLQLIQNSPQYSNAQKQQAATAAQQVQQQAAALDLQKTDYLNAQNQALQYAGSATAAQMQQLQQGKTAVEVATLATNMGISTPAQQKILADLEIQKAQIANLPLEKQLKQAQVYEAQAGAKLKQAQAAAMSNPVGTNGLVAGTTVSPTIDATTPGYSSIPVAGGLTQASIDQKALYYVTSGTMPPQGRTGISGIQNMAISNRMAELGNNTNLAANKSVLKADSQSLAAQQTYFDNTQRAFNTANDTLASLQTYMSQNGVNPSQFPDYNKFSNYLKSKGLDAGTAGGYNAQIETLRQEYSQVLAKGGVRSVETDNQAAKLIPNGLAPADLAKVAAQIQIDSNNVINDSQKQIDTIQARINKIIQPTAKSSAATNITAAGVPFNYTQAKADGVSDAAIQAYLASH